VLFSVYSTEKQGVECYLLFEWLIELYLKSVLKFMK
jgi:hypothetical protein